MKLPVHIIRRIGEFVYETSCASHARRVWHSDEWTSLENQKVTNHFSTTIHIIFNKIRSLKFTFLVFFFGFRSDERFSTRSMQIRKSTLGTSVCHQQLPFSFYFSQFKDSNCFAKTFWFVWSGEVVFAIIGMGDANEALISVLHSRVDGPCP